MAFDVTGLAIKIDPTGAEAGARRVNRALDSIPNKAKRALNQTAGAFDRLKRQVFSLKTAIAGIGFGLIIREIIQTNVEFQRLSTAMKTVVGDAKAASDQMKVLTRFASETPFQIAEITSGFIKLRARGLNPTIDSIRDIGNLASAMGKSFDQAIEAIADAAFGEAERLKEFGIIMRTTGETVRITFGGITQEVKKNAKEITEALLGISRTNFGDAMQAQMDTLGGAFSNLGDATSQLSIQIGEGGLNSAIQDVTRQLVDATQGASNFGRELGAKLGDAVRGLGSAFKFLAEHMDAVVIVGTAIVGMKLGAAFGPWGAAIGLVAGAIGGYIATTESAIESTRRFKDAIGNSNDIVREATTLTLAQAEAIERQTIATLNAANAVETLKIRNLTDTLDIIGPAGRDEFTDAGREKLRLKIQQSLGRMVGNDEAAAEAIARAYDLVRKATMAVSDAVDDTDDATKKLIKTYGALSFATKRATDAALAHEKALAATIDSEADLANTITRQVLTPLQLFNEQVAILDRLVDKSLITDGTYALAFADAGEAMRDATGETQRLAEATAEAERAAKEMAQPFIDAARDIERGFNDAFSRYSEVPKTVI